MDNSILAIVSHPDDEVFGCGGTLARHVKAGLDVDVLCLTCDPISRKVEFEEAVNSLGVRGTLFEGDIVEYTPLMIRRVADLIDEKRPDVVITHVPFDYHREHKACYEVVKEAAEWAAHTTMYEDAWKVNRLLLMEVNTLIPNPSVYVDVTDVFDVKLRAIERYSSQLAKFPWGYYQRVSLKKAELRGAQCDVLYAEAFLEESLPRNGPFYQEKVSRLLA